MAEPIDEWVVQSLTEYQGKKLKPVHKGEIDLGDKEDKKEKKEAEKKYKSLLAFWKEKISEVQDVRLSSRLTDSACCLVADEHAPGAHMEKVFKAMNQSMPPSKPVLEVNPDHPLIIKIQELFQKDEKHPKLEEYGALLVNQAQMLEGKKLGDPKMFASRFNALLEEESKALIGAEN